MINAFSNYSIGLDVLEDVGLSRNFTRDLNEIEIEIDNIKEKEISGLIIIIITILFMAVTLWIWRYLKIKGNAKLLQHLRTTEASKTEDVTI